MSEVTALNKAWSQYASKIGLPQTVHWESGYQQFGYASKYIFDKGWEAAMDYVAGK